LILQERLAPLSNAPFASHRLENDAASPGVSVSIDELA
jgi:hypothetical protein